jgi:hypothetical protein
MIPNGTLEDVQGQETKLVISEKSKAAPTEEMTIQDQGGMIGVILGMGLKKITSEEAISEDSRKIRGGEALNAISVTKKVTLPEIVLSRRLIREEVATKEGTNIVLGERVSMRVGAETGDY